MKEFRIAVCKYETNELVGEYSSFHIPREGEGIALLSQNIEDPDDIHQRRFYVENVMFIVGDPNPPDGFDGSYIPDADIMLFVSTEEEHDKMLDEQLTLIDGE